MNERPLQPVAKQVITIGPDGSMAGLQRKPSQGLDLRRFGVASIVRASEIVWGESSQKWSIKLLTEPHINTTVTSSLMYANGLAWFDFPGCGLNASDAPGTLVFEDYEQAVTAEIALLDAMRLAGKLSRSA